MFFFEFNFALIVLRVPERLNQRAPPPCDILKLRRPRVDSHETPGEGILVDKVLTYHVQCDGAGYRRHHVIVGRLTCEHGVQMTAFQPFQPEHVFHLPVRQRFERLVDQRVFLPPRDFRRRTSCEQKPRCCQSYDRQKRL